MSLKYIKQKVVGPENDLAAAKNIAQDASYREKIVEQLFEKADQWLDPDEDLDEERISNAKESIINNGFGSILTFDDKWDPSPAASTQASSLTYTFRWSLDSDLLKEMLLSQSALKTSAVFSPDWTTLNDGDVTESKQQYLVVLNMLLGGKGAFFDENGNGLTIPVTAVNAQELSLMKASQIVLDNYNKDYSPNDLQQIFSQLKENLDQNTEVYHTGNSNDNIIKVLVKIHKSIIDTVPVKEELETPAEQMMSGKTAHTLAVTTDKLQDRNNKLIKIFKEVIMPGAEKYTGDKSRLPNIKEQLDNFEMIPAALGEFLLKNQKELRLSKPDLLQIGADNSKFEFKFIKHNISEEKVNNEFLKTGFCTVGIKNLHSVPPFDSETTRAFFIYAGDMHEDATKNQLNWLELLNKYMRPAPNLLPATGDKKSNKKQKSASDLQKEKSRLNDAKSKKEKLEKSKKESSYSGGTLFANLEKAQKNAHLLSMGSKGIGTGPAGPFGEVFHRIHVRDLLVKASTCLGNKMNGGDWVQALCKGLLKGLINDIGFRAVQEVIVKPLIDAGLTPPGVSKAEALKWAGGYDFDAYMDTIDGTKKVVSQTGKNVGNLEFIPQPGQGTQVTLERKRLVGYGSAAKSEKIPMNIPDTVGIFKSNVFNKQKAAVKRDSREINRFLDEYQDFIDVDALCERLAQFVDNLPKQLFQKGGLTKIKAGAKNIAPKLPVPPTLGFPDSLSTNDLLKDFTDALVKAIMESIIQTLVALIDAVMADILKYCEDTPDFFPKPNPNADAGLAGIFGENNIFNSPDKPVGNTPLNDDKPGEPEGTLSTMAGALSNKEGSSIDNDINSLINGDPNKMAKAMRALGIPPSRLQDITNLFEDLTKFLFPLETCSLLSGEPSIQVLSSVQFLIEEKYETLAIYLNSKSKIKRLFHLLGENIELEICNLIVRDITPSEAVCSSLVSTDAKRQVLASKGFSDDQIEKMIRNEDSIRTARLEEIAELLTNPDALQDRTPSIFDKAGHTPQDVLEITDDMFQTIVDTYRVPLVQELDRFKNSLITSSPQLDSFKDSLIMTMPADNLDTRRVAAGIREDVNLLSNYVSSYGRYEQSPDGTIKWSTSVPQTSAFAFTINLQSTSGATASPASLQDVEIPAEIKQKLSEQENLVTYKIPVKDKNNWNEYLNGDYSVHFKTPAGPGVFEVEKSTDPEIISLIKNLFGIPLNEENITAGPAVGVGDPAGDDLPDLPMDFQQGAGVLGVEEPTYNSKTIDLLSQDLPQATIWSKMIMDKVRNLYPGIDLDNSTFSQGAGALEGSLKNYYARYLVLYVQNSMQSFVNNALFNINNFESLEFVKKEAELDPIRKICVDKYKDIMDTDSLVENAVENYRQKENETIERDITGDISSIQEALQELSIMSIIRLAILQPLLRGIFAFSELDVKEVLSTDLGLAIIKTQLNNDLFEYSNNNKYVDLFNKHLAEIRPDDTIDDIIKQELDMMQPRVENLIKEFSSNKSLDVLNSISFYDQTYMDVPSPMISFNQLQDITKNGNFFEHSAGEAGGLLLKIKNIMWQEDARDITSHSLTSDQKNKFKFFDTNDLTIPTNQFVQNQKQTRLADTSFDGNFFFQKYVRVKLKKTWEMKNARKFINFYPNIDFNSYKSYKDNNSWEDKFDQQKLSEEFTKNFSFGGINTLPEVIPLDEFERAVWNAIQYPQTDIIISADEVPEGEEVTTEFGSGNVQEIGEQSSYADKKIADYLDVSIGIRLVYCLPTSEDTGASLNSAFEDIANIAIEEENKYHKQIRESAGALKSYKKVLDLNLNAAGWDDIKDEIPKEIRDYMIHEPAGDDAAVVQLNSTANMYKTYSVNMIPIASEEITLTNKSSQMRFKTFNELVQNIIGHPGDGQFNTANEYPASNTPYGKKIRANVGGGAYSDLTSYVQDIQNNFQFTGPDPLETGDVYANQRYTRWGYPYSAEEENFNNQTAKREQIFGGYMNSVFETYEPELREKMKTNPEYKILNDYLFNHERLKTLGALYSMSHPSMRDATGFTQTKKSLKALFETSVVDAGQSHKYSIEDKHKSGGDFGSFIKKQQSLGSSEAESPSFSPSIGPAVVLKAFAQATDPVVSKSVNIQGITGAPDYTVPAIAAGLMAAGEPITPYGLVALGISFSLPGNLLDKERDKKLGGTPGAYKQAIEDGTITLECEEPEYEGEE